MNVRVDDNLETKSLNVNMTEQNVVSEEEFHDAGMNIYILWSKLELRGKESWLSYFVRLPGVLLLFFVAYPHGAMCWSAL